MNLKKYPHDWKQISAQAKARAGFKDELTGEEPTRRNPLTVHHFDGDTFNSDPANLVCLTARNHLLIHSVYKGIHNKHDLTCLMNFINSQLKFNFFEGGKK